MPGQALPPSSSDNAREENLKLRTGISPEETTGVHVPVFISYARIDEEMLDFVQSFSRQLKYFVNSYTSEFNLEVFVDVESLDWGDDWPQNIEEQLNAASIFIPFLSGNYLRRDNCRAEFMQFYQGARTLGITELILPVMLFDSPDLFGTESADPIAAASSRINHISLIDGIRAGVGSPAWRASMMDAATKFISAYSKAESKLASMGSAELAPEQNGATPFRRPLGMSEDGGGEDDDRPGLLDIHESIAEISEEMVVALTAMQPAIAELGAVAVKATDNAPKDRKQAQSWAIRAAEGFKGPSSRIGEMGTTVLNCTSRLDIEIRHLASLSSDIPSIADGENGVASITSSLSSLEEVKDKLNSLIESFKTPEAMSAAIRKALRPAREGLTKITDSISVMNSWRDLK